MFRRLFLSISFLITSLMGFSQGKTDPQMMDILRRNTDSLFQQVLARPVEFRVQIIYTQINRDKDQKPQFTNHYFNYDPELYFNPASMVKLPLALLSLEKLNRMNVPGVNKFTPIVFDSSEPWQRPLYHDTTAKSGVPSIAHLIKRALLVSENDPYNRMYQFVGQQTANDELHRKGYKDVRIARQFMRLSSEENRYTNQVKFLNADGKVLLIQPATYNTQPLDFSKVIKVGNAHMDRNDSLVLQPFDFTEHNRLSLESMRRMLQSVMFPESVPANARFQLTGDDYSFLYRYLSQYPSETPDPKYDEIAYYDSYVKFFFRDSSKRMPDGVRVFNKVGWSYGFLTDVSYVADFNNNVEYMLAATVYVNSDGVLNDGKYEYKTVGWPFLHELGQTIYKYELSRKRDVVPDLSSFKVPYEKRDPNDKRPTLKDIDN